ncbi:MAG TPA: hypothetical protein VKZ98_11465 [Aquaticitalea sp.]|nr:hypothetical protein [Aquaticitalea sp.]
MKHIFLLLLAFPLFFACKDSVKKAGHIQIEAAIYHDPTGDLYNSDLVPISDLYFMGNRFVEEVPYQNDSLGVKRFALIENGKATFSNSLDQLLTSNEIKEISEKKYGALFTPPPVPDYDEREVIADTAFGGYNYKRIRIVTDSAYSVFYIHKTDTLIPFSLAPQIDKDYKGILNRIDTYDKVNDRFVSLRMTVTDTIPQSIYSIIKNSKNEKN